MQEHGYDAVDPFAHQRRLRHLSEVLVRNLTVPAAFGSSSTSSRSFTGPAHTLGTYNAAYGDTWSSLAGTSSPGLDRSASPTKTVRRSKDDLDLQRPAFQRTYPSRRKLTVSHGAGASLPSQGSIASGLDHRPSFPPSGRLDVKGKGKESGLASSSDALNVIREGDGAATVDGAGLEGLETDESDLIYGWTSANRLPAPLVRSKSKSSLKSSSSRRSISSSVSKRLFKQNKRHRNSLNGSDEDEDSDTSENDSTRKASSSRYERPQSPLSPHVSFRMASQHDPTFTAGLSQHLEGDLPASISAAARRARSASRGSILSVASGSSASTIRASGLTRHSEKEERFLRLKRYEDVRSHLVRSRLTLSLLQEQGSTAATLSATPRPPITRTRTISLPIRGESAEANARSGPAGHMGSATFYISEPHKRSMEPSFPLDFSARATMLGGTAALCHIHTLIARIWVQTDPESVETGSDDSDWKLLLEWEVDLRKLISLGTDPRLFPRRLPPNTLIFKVSNTDEYLTARLPAFLLADAQDEAEEGAGARHSTGNMIEDEEGNVSDPGPPSSSSLSVTTRRREDASLMLRRDATRVREAMLAKRKAILDRSLRETRMVQSVDDAELAKIISMEQEMKCLRMEVTRMRCRVDELLQDESFVKHREHSDRVLSLEQYARDKTAVEEERTARALRCQNRRQHLNERRNRLQQARERLDRQNRRLEVSMANHHLDLEVYRSISLSASQQRAGLISELSTIFPIELVDPTHVLFSICELPLPNGDFEGQQQAQRRLKHDLDDDHISSALGFVAQVVQLLAAYLTVPLYYPIRCMGSRSLVQDPISQMKGPKIFPLYSKGVDKYRFEYAVFLLNKDIEQVMLEYNIGLMDLAQTLPNLKNIYLTLSSDASTRNAKETVITGKGQALSTTASQPIVLKTETILARSAPEMTVESNIPVQLEPSDTPDVNGNIVSRPNGATASALEKILGGAWTSRNGDATANQSQAKGRLRHAEASKTMTLLGGKNANSARH